MSTTLEPAFLQAALLLHDFKGPDMVRCQCGLLALGLTCPTFCAADLPAAVTGGNVHLAGCATGALVATGMIEVIGRIKSPKPSAKGRRLDLLRLPPENYAKAETFLHRHGVTLRDVQQQLAI